jgi:hypothetical protein
MPLVCRRAAMRHAAARAAWPAAAVAFFALAAAFTMWPWLDPELVPGNNDFMGFAAEVEWTRRTLDREGTLPTWTTDRFGGSTRFMSNLKEIATYPLAARYGAVHGTKLMFALMRIIGALGVYLICARYLRSPAAGLIAGYGYGFGAPANLESTVGGHLDVVISSVLFPAILLIATAMLQRRRQRDAMVLGALVALEFSVHSYVQAMTVPVMVLLLVWLRPWRRDPTEESLFTDATLAGRWLGLGATALVVFLLLAVSQIAWLVADLPNHRLLSSDQIAQGLRTFVEHSPFMYVNRADWLGGWLAEHRPPGMLVSVDDHFFNQRRYLGLVALALCGCGWFRVRSDFTLRRWFQVFLLLFTFQYWMAIGPHTLVWQLGRTFHWPERVDELLRALLSLGAVACLAWGTLLLTRRRRHSGAVPFARVELAFGIALFQIVATHSLFGIVAAILPVLGGMRSPGHFFDLAPFPFFAMLGVAVSGAIRRVAAPARALLVPAILGALVLDYLPTVSSFEQRRDEAALRTMRNAVTMIAGDDGSLRMVVPSATQNPAASLIAASASAGSAWSWLPWQAGPYWEPYLSVAMASLSSDIGDPRILQAARPVTDALMRSGRLRYVLEEISDVQRLRIEPHWVQLAQAGPFALWDSLEVLPMGTVFPAYVLFVGGTERDQAPAIATAFRRGILSLAGGDRLADNAEAVVAGASIILSMGAEALNDPASRQLASRHVATLVDRRDASASERWRSLLEAVPPRAPRAAQYSRPAPDQMLLDVEATGSPAILFVSEAYHPWWHARVDGTTAEMLRAGIAFMAVRVPSGSHRVELEFRPPLALRAADRLTELSWIALGVALLVAAVRAARDRGATRAPRPSPPGAPS